MGDFLGLMGVLGVPLGEGGDFLQRRAGFLEGGGLLAGTFGEALAGG